MNTYLQSMKNALSSYYAAAKAYEEKADRAKQRYQEDVAANEIKKLDAELETQRQGAIDSINEAKDKAIEAVRRWGALDGNKIDYGDMKLLKFDLSLEQFEAIVERHKKNGTMCFILLQCGEAHNRKHGENSEFDRASHYDTSIIPTVEKKIAAYTRFAESAVDAVKNMRGIGFGQGVSSPIMINIVETFGEPNPTNYDLLEMIG